MSDFVALILTHGRPNAVRTYNLIRNHGYTGPIRLVVDDLDKTRPEYIAKYGDEVVTFDKRKAGEHLDMGDNRIKEMRTITFARNASFDVAERLGFKYFIQLDDDFTELIWRFDEDLNYIEKHYYRAVYCLDRVFEAMLKFFKACPNISSIAMAQRGDFVGGSDSDWAKSAQLRRKCMNSFICATDRRFEFLGRYNEDVNTYVRQGSTGTLLFTTNQLSLKQSQSSTVPGGMSEAYREQGTYQKPFYSVMFAPSCVKIRMLVTGHNRIHHAVKWNNAVPKILREEWRKVSGNGASGDSVKVYEPAETIRSRYLDKVKESDLHGYLALVAKYRPHLDLRHAASVALASIRYYNGSGELRDLLVAGRELEAKWYASLKRGAPDYSVYDDDFFISDLWACWVVYSRKYLKDLCHPKGTADGPVVARIRPQVGSVADLGCGMGYTTAALKELFPDATVYGTNLEDTFQWEVAHELGERTDFGLLPSASQPADLVFASEYFEHIEAPVEHLLDVLDKAKPKFLVLANSFGAKSIGHFDTYRHKGQKVPNTAMGRLFNGHLRTLGYELQKTKFWNNRPAFWAKRS